MDNRHREVRMVACMSLDGYISDGQGSANQESAGGWTSAEDKREFWREVGDADVLVAGRKTLNQLPNREGIPPVCLVTRHPDEPLESDLPVEWAVDPYPSEVHDFMTKVGGKRYLVCGGSMTYDFFLRWNLVDYLVLIVEPLTLGRGVRLRTPPLTKGGQDRARFSLIKARPLNARGTLRIDLRRAKTW